MSRNTYSEQVPFACINRDYRCTGNMDYAALEMRPMPHISHFVLIVV
jgi:hypothetical protein